MAITDKQRIDFLARQKFTRWVGYDTENGYCVWPVFENGDLRAEIDWAIKKSAQQSVQSDGADTCAVCGGWLGSKRACDECGHIRPAAKA